MYEARIHKENRCFRVIILRSLKYNIVYINKVCVLENIINTTAIIKEIVFKTIQAFYVSLFTIHIFINF